MAEKRMFAKSIVLSDAFLDMPMSARCLYFTLGMLADDDGFVDGPKSIMRQCGASQDDLAILVGKRFVLLFDTGVIVIKHWRINNYLRSDRYTPTSHIKEKASIEVDSNGAYTERAEISSRTIQALPDGSGIPVGIPPGIPSIGKYREEKSREEEISMSVSNDTDCSTDVQRIVDAWNAIDGIPKVQKLSPDSKRGKSLGARIKEYGVEKVLEAIAEIPESSFLTGKAKKQFKITFDWFVLPNNFPKVLEGNYRDGPKKVYAQDDLFYRTGKTLGNRVSRRLGLPEDTEETRQTYAAEMEACAKETGADVGTEIKDAVFFSQSDPYWQSRIVDAKSFRLNFRKILADMRRKDS